MPKVLLPPGDPDENAVRTLGELSAEFLKANARSWSWAGSGEDTLYGVERVPGQEAAPATTEGSGELHPAHLDALTLRLTPERYRELALALSALLSAAYQEGHSRSGEVCTLAILGFRNTRASEEGGVERRTSTFLPWPGLPQPSTQ